MAALRYKGYVAIIDVDGDAALLHGEVFGLRDVITFEAESIPALKEAFKKSVEDYLEFCRERGEEPERPFSGRISLRIGPILHRELALKAREEGKSLNRWIGEKLEGELSEGLQWGT